MAHGSWSESLGSVRHFSRLSARFCVVLTLLVIQGPDKGRRFELPDAPVVLGRDSRQLPITDNTASRRHAELLPAEGQWFLHDLGSSNGTYLNGTRVSNRAPLKLGDQIRIGRSVMVFGAQPGIARSPSGSVTIAGEEAGMDSAIVAAVPSNEDSMVLAVPEPAAVAMTNLKLLYQLNAQLGSSFDVNQVLEVVMDLVFEHVKAERGILLLVDPRTGELSPTIVRTREEENGDKKPVNIHASRTILSHVLATSEAVLSTNAMADQRFSKGKSVHDLGIRSAICVPIKSKRLDDKAGDQVLGLIYIDSSVKNYTYSPDQLRLLSAIGMQAGMAVQNAKLYHAQLQAERMAAIGETTAALSHSIKNILQALHGGADVVEMGLRGNNLAQAGKGWKIVRRNLDKIYGLTMNLLAYSKQREPRLEMVRPQKLVEECVELVAAAAAEKAAMVVADIDPDHPPVPMDPDGMHQVIMNLLSNALDAINHEGGLIRVEGRFDAEAEQSVIQVIDNGVGVAPPMMKHMFELFHSTKGNRGTGLGLAVARKIVSEHEGSISVESTEGQGTCFTIRLPVRHVSLADPSHTHGPAK